MVVRNLLLDTNAYAAFKRGAEDAIEIIRHAPRIGISVVVLGELLAGFAAGTREATNRRELQQFLRSDRVILLTVDGDTSERYSVVYLNLRRKGRPIPTNDLWIAASALQHDLAVFSYDDHFQHVDGIFAGQQLKDFLL